MISAADPLHLAAMNSAAKSVTAIGANRIVYGRGIPLAAALGSRVEALTTLDGDTLNRVREALQTRHSAGASSTMRARSIRV